jgi:hypothetical protein
MRALIAVMAREVSERRLVLVAAAAVAVLPFGAPLLPGVESHLDGDVRDTGAALLATVISVLAGLGLGAGLFPNSPRFRGLGFFHARPVSAGALWAGKTLAATGITLAVGVIVAFPPVLVGGECLLASWEDTWPLLWMGVMAVPAGHLAALAFRSRSALILVDLAVFAGVALVWAKQAIQMVGIVARFDVANRSAFLWFAAVTVGLLGASLGAVALGRTDVTRSRRVASAALAMGQLTVIPMMALWMGWMVRSTPASIDAVYRVSPAPRGSWVIVNGTARGAWSKHIVDLETGQYARAGNEFGGGYEVMTPEICWLEQLTGDGGVASSIEFPGAEALLISPEVGDGVVVVTAEPQSQRWRAAPVHRVDLAAGSAVEIGVGLKPARALTDWGLRNCGNRPPPGAYSTHLFLRAEAVGESLVRLDPWTGEIEVLLGPGESGPSPPDAKRLEAP